MARQCFLCGTTRQRLVNHHIDGDPTNNAPSNFIVLCHPCHIHSHGQGWLSLEELMAHRDKTLPPPESIQRESGLRQLVYNDLMGRQRTESVAKEWAAVAAEFEEVRGFKESYDRADVVNFLAHLRKRELALTTIMKDLKVIKLICQIQGWPKGFPKVSLPRVKEQDITRTIFTKEQVISLIQMGRQLLEPMELCYLALATTYGLRRQEMCKPKPPQFEDGKVIIYTVHGASEKTTHLVPPELAPYLENFLPYGPDWLSHIFLRILGRVGIRVGANYGWHSIRRSLATELILSEASALNVMRFMRWSEASLKGEFGMLAIYAKRDQARIDEDIFKIHPFLPYWGKME